jgi:hypothetical protein
MNDPRYWQWWQDKLAGVDVPASEGTPYAGFYRWVRKASYGGTKYAIPVAYWPGEDGEMHCREGFRDVSEERGQDIWVNVCNHPVEEAWYREIAEQDKSEWRDGMAISPPKGDNRPPDEMSFEWLWGKLNDIEEGAKVSLADETRAYLAGPPITEQTEADKISNLADKLSELWKKADEARKKERAPHDDAIKAIQVKWTPLLLLAEAYKNLKFKLLTPWQLAQQKALEEEARAAVAAGEPVPETTRRPRAGTRGRAMTLKSFKSAEITDYDQCLAFFKENSEIRLTVQDLANKAVRAGVTVPGTKVIEDQRTV